MTVENTPDKKPNIPDDATKIVDEGEEKVLTPEEMEQAIKDREAELASRSSQKVELETEPTPVAAPATPAPTPKDEEDDFWKDDKKNEDKDPAVSKEELRSMIEAAMKPLVEKTQAQDEAQRKRAREAFFARHPEYLKDANKWQSLLDEMQFFDPKQVEYGTLLEKAHVIASGGAKYDVRIEQAKANFATDASGDSGNAAPRVNASSNLTAQERAIAKAWGVSDDAMANMKKKTESGDMQLFYPVI